MNKETINKKQFTNFAKGRGEMIKRCREIDRKRLAERRKATEQTKAGLIYRCP